MEAGKTIKYGVRLPTQERYEVADLNALRETYPEGHITHRVVSDGAGGSTNVEFTGKQPYEVAEEKRMKARDARRAEIEGMSVDELRAGLVEVDVPENAKKDDLRALLIEHEGVAEPVVEEPVAAESEGSDRDAKDAAVSETKASLAGERTEGAPTEPDEPKLGVEAENRAVSRDTGRRSRS